MKSVLNFFLLLSFLSIGTLSAQVQNVFDFDLTSGNVAYLDEPTVCQGFPLEICGSYGLDQTDYWDFVNLDVTGLNFTLLSLDEENKTFCISLSEDNYDSAECLDIVVVLSFEDGNGNDLTVSSSALEVCIEQITCECLYYELSNIVCYSNGTADFEDDYWSFDLIVYNNINANSTWTADPLGITGVYGVKQTVFAGTILDVDSLTLNIYDNNFPDDCNAKLEVTAPENCSDGCGFFVSSIIGECTDGGTEDNLSDDVYSVEIDISNNSLNVWEVYRTYVNDNTSELLGTGVGDSKIDLGNVEIIYGDWVLSGYLVNDPDCQAVDFVEAPDFCSGCQEVIVNNVVCDDKNTATQEDDTWSFDIQVLGGTGEEYRIPAYEIQEPYGTVAHIEAGIISNCIELDIFDVENPMECNSYVLVCPPETCSEPVDCDFELEVGKLECSKFGDESTFVIGLLIEGTGGACWKITKINLDGTTEILLTDAGDKEFKLGPFEESIDFTLVAELCDDPDCTLSYEIDAPACPTLQPEDDINLRSYDGLQIYPNPVGQEGLTIEFDESIKSFSIYNTQGQVIIPQTVVSGKFINSFEQMPGIYFLITIDNQGDLQQNKFIKL